MAELTRRSFRSSLVNVMSNSCVSFIELYCLILESLESLCTSRALNCFWISTSCRNTALWNSENRTDFLIYFNIVQWWNKRETHPALVLTYISKLLNSNLLNKHYISWIVDKRFVFLQSNVYAGQHVFVSPDHPKV